MVASSFSFPATALILILFNGCVTYKVTGQSERAVERNNPDIVIITKKECPSPWFPITRRATSEESVSTKAIKAYAETSNHNPIGKALTAPGFFLGIGITVAAVVSDIALTPLNILRSGIEKCRSISPQRVTRVAAAKDILYIKNEGAPIKDKPNGTQKSILAEGTKGSVISSEDTWTHMTFPSGLDGWVSRADLTFAEPDYAAIKKRSTHKKEMARIMAAIMLVKNWQVSASLDLAENAQPALLTIAERTTRLLDMFPDTLTGGTVISPVWAAKRIRPNLYAVTCEYTLPRGLTPNKPRSCGLYEADLSRESVKSGDR
jgi:hypothetical protein